MLRIYDYFYFETRDLMEIPAEIDFSLVGLQKTTVLGVSDKGDIPRMEYRSGSGDLVCARDFAFAYATNEKGATLLTVTETPIWYDVYDESHAGRTKTQVYEGARYNVWRDSARARIFEGLKTWLPEALYELEIVETIPEGEALSGGWLAANHAVPWDLYMKTGRRDTAYGIDASLAADQTDWLDSVVPDNTIPGLESGSTVREMILGALR